MHLSCSGIPAVFVAGNFTQGRTGVKMSLDRKDNGQLYCGKKADMDLNSRSFAITRMFQGQLGQDRKDRAVVSAFSLMQGR